MKFCHPDAVICFSTVEVKGIVLILSTNSSYFSDATDSK